MEIGAFGDRKYYVCHKTGHIARNCPQKMGGRGKEQGKEQRKSSKLECFHCHKCGHIKADCYKGKKEKEREKTKKEKNGIKIPRRMSLGR